MSLGRLLEHRRLWREKPVLARVYEPWFDAILAAAPSGARVLEVGAGPGLLHEHARERRPDLRWVASDLHAAPWNAVAADASRLPLRGGSVAAVVGVDVLHHLAAPAAFFAEAARVLVPRGRLVLLEPWITPLSWVIYRFFHQEDCRLSVDGWDPFPGGAKDSFDGDAAVPWRIVRDSDPSRWTALGFAPPHVRRESGFAYLLSLGFRPRTLLPLFAVPVARALDRAAGPFAPLVALRAAIDWQRAG